MRKAITLVFFVLLSILFYRNIFNGYFQSDEWFYFSQFLPILNGLGGLYVALIKSITETGVISGGGHMTPIYTLIWYLHNLFFKLNYFPYIFISVLVHGVNGALLFSWVYSLTKRISISMVAGIFFVTSFAHFQAVTWVMAYIPTVYSVFFLLISLLLLTQSLSGQLIGKRKLIASLIFLILAILTKETAVVGLVIYIMLILILKKSSFIPLLFKWLVPISIAYILFRFVLSAVVERSSVALLDKLPPLDLNIFRAIVYPIRIMALSFVPVPQILKLSDNFSKFAYPSFDINSGAQQRVIQGPVSDIFLLLFGVLIIFTAIKIGRGRNLHRKEMWIVYMSLVIVLTCALPLLLISTYAPWWGFSIFIDPRHIYIGSIGAGILFAFLFSTISSSLSKYISKGVIHGLLFVILLTWMWANYNLLQAQIAEDVKVGRMRQTVIASLLNSVKVLPENAIFLVESQNSYYGFSHIPPFQTNLGQIIAVQYFNKGQIEKAFVTDLYFSKGIEVQGVISHEGHSFGYYFNQNALLRDILNKKILPQNIVAFTWDENTNTLKNNSIEKRKLYAEFSSTAKLLQDWTKKSDKLFSFSYPKEAELSEFPGQLYSYEISSVMGGVKIEILQKKKEDPFHEYIATQIDSRGNLIQDDFLIDNAIRYDGTLVTYLKLKNYEEYFVPFSSGEYYLKVTSDNPDNNVLVKGILSTIFF